MMSNNIHVVQDQRDHHKLFDFQLKKITIEDIYTAFIIKL